MQDTLKLKRVDSLVRSHLSCCLDGNLVQSCYNIALSSHPQLFSNTYISNPALMTEIAHTAVAPPDVDMAEMAKKKKQTFMLTAMSNLLQVKHFTH